MRWPEDTPRRWCLSICSCYGVGDGLSHEHRDSYAYLYPGLARSCWTRPVSFWASVWWPELVAMGLPSSSRTSRG